MPEYGAPTEQTFLFFLTDDLRRALMRPFLPNGVWLLIVICGWRNTGVSVLIFSVSLLRAFLFRYCRDSVSSLQPGRIHRHTHRHGINYTQGAWFVGSHSPPTGEPEVHPPLPSRPPASPCCCGRNRKNHEWAQAVGTPHLRTRFQRFRSG